jgi:hypothetical protein
MTEAGHGTSGGVELTEEGVRDLADEAEEGYDAEEVRTRERRGRPAMGAEAASVFHVRLPPELRKSLESAADAMGTTPSDVVRKALDEFLDR